MVPTAISALLSLWKIHATGDLVFVMPQLHVQELDSPENYIPNGRGVYDPLYAGMFAFQNLFEHPMAIVDYIFKEHTCFNLSFHILWY